jgi:hypothetical protein
MRRDSARSVSARTEANVPVAIRASAAHARTERHVPTTTPTYADDATRERRRRSCSACPVNRSGPIARSIRTFVRCALRRTRSPARAAPAARSTTPRVVATVEAAARAHELARTPTRGLPRTTPTRELPRTAAPMTSRPTPPTSSPRASDRSDYSAALQRSNRSAGEATGANARPVPVC